MVINTIAIFYMALFELYPTKVKYNQYMENKVYPIYIKEFKLEGLPEVYDLLEKIDNGDAYLCKLLIGGNPTYREIGSECLKIYNKFETQIGIIGFMLLFYLLMLIGLLLLV